MASTGSAVYGLELQSRCIAAVVGETDRHNFLVGTIGLKSTNQIILLQYVESSQCIDCVAVWQNKAEIWQLACCPAASKKNLFLALQSGTTFDERQCTLFSMDVDTLEHKSLMSVAVPPSTHLVLWDPQGLSDTVAIVDGKSLSTWKLDGGSKFSSVVNFGGSAKTEAATWDPHHNELIAVASSNEILRVDMRQKKHTVALENCHSGRIRDIEYNPNKIYQVATCGEDGLLRIWDIRKKDGLLKSVDAHDHWINCVHYNPQHDEFLLTAGCDNVVKLWLLPSVASSSVAYKPEEEGLVKVCKDFEDSVYSVAWSACSPWVYLSVAYNGKVLAHQIPQELKYRILLSDE